MIGRSTGEMHRLGDRVEVRLVEVAPLAGALRFELLSSGRILPRAERGKDARFRPGAADARRAKAKKAARKIPKKGRRRR